ncbi:MAG: hypothetical protein V9F01_05030 [Chitinophagaceae bacterium]
MFKAIFWARPDIIFEEMQVAHHDFAYRVNEPTDLEITAVKRYLKNRNVLHIPVDTYPTPKGFVEDINKLTDAIEHSDTSEAKDLMNLVNEHSAIVASDGLRFLNSDENDKYMLEIDSLTEKVLIVLNDNELFRIFKMDMQNRRDREYEIMQNIYRYSIEYPFYKAIMLIGAGHRKYIISLINEFQEQAELKLNWKPY